MAKQPLKVGVLVGREWSWPPAFIDEVNRRDQGVTAEFVKLGGTQMDEPSPYRVIVDRISHEVPYYRSYLKNAALQGVKVINDPFMWTADDKFFGASLATQLGVASPKTVVLPNKDYIQGIVHDESLRNLVYPLDWQEIVRYVGLPAVLKDAHGGGWRDVYVVHNMEELWSRYNQSGTLTMILQEFIHWESYARCMCLGQSEVYVMNYDPNTRHYGQPDFSPELHDRIVNDSLKLVQALGYDMNTIEFAIRDGIPYAIDFMNPAPDMDVHSLGQTHFDWMVNHMADLVIRLAKGTDGTQERYEWAKVVRSIRKASKLTRTGRPRTLRATASVGNAAATSLDANAPKRRGRKPGSRNKPKQLVAAPATATPAESSKNAPKRRGRKPGSRNKPKQTAAASTSQTAVNNPPKRRGRPPRNRPAQDNSSAPTAQSVQSPTEPDGGA